MLSAVLMCGGQDIAASQVLSVEPADTLTLGRSRQLQGLWVSQRVQVPDD